MSPGRSRLRAWIVLAVLAVPTAVLAYLQLGMGIDAENQAMKSQGTPEAASLARRVALFGDDHVVLAAFRPRQPERTISPREDGELTRLLDAIAGHPGVRGVRRLDGAADARIRTFALQIGSPAEDAGYAATVRALERDLHQGCPPTLRPVVSGTPMVEVAIADAVATEQSTIVPAIAGALLLVLLGFYRHLGVALAALAPAAAGIAWTGGVLAWTGHRLDPIAVLIQPVLLTVGVAGSVHLVEGYLRRVHRDGPDRAAAHTVRDLLTPSVLACATTVVGFLALTTNAIPAVADFGAYAAWGVAITCALAMWVVPAGLVAWVGVPRAGSPSPSRGAVARWAAATSVRRAPAVLAVVAAIGALALWQCGSLAVDNDPLRVLPAAHPLRVDTEELAARLGGVESFDLLVAKGSDVHDPARLRLLAADVLGRDGVVGLASAPQVAASGELLLSPLLVRSGSSAREELFDGIERDLRDLGQGDVSVTGTAVQVARDSNRLVRGQLRGLLLTLAALWAVMALGLRSLRLGLVGLLPNVLTCALVYGSLAWAGRPLSVATAMIGSVMLGLVVDDTIHFLDRFRRARRRCTPPVVAVASSFGHAGRPIVITSAVLATGFLVSAFGRLDTTVEFGVLAGATILVALVIGLIVLPALLVVGRRNGVRAEVAL